MIHTTLKQKTVGVLDVVNHCHGGDRQVSWVFGYDKIIDWCLLYFERFSESTFGWLLVLNDFTVMYDYFYYGQPFGMTVLSLIVCNLGGLTLPFTVLKSDLI